MQVSIENKAPIVFFPATKKAELKQLEWIDRLSASKCPLEELLNSWFCLSLKDFRFIDKKITFTRINRSNLEILNVCLETKQGPFVLGEFSVAHLMQHYGKFKPLKEEIYKFADKEGFTVDHEWFELRNKRLGIKFSESYGEFTLPTAALYELILSYAMSSLGMVRIQRDLVEDYKYNIRHAYKIELVYLGKGENDKTCWTEKLILLEDRLQKYLQKKLA